MKDLEQKSDKKLTGHSLDEGQLTFIDKCKKQGLLGCSITINNTQTWICFINKH